MFFFSNGKYNYIDSEGCYLTKDPVDIAYSFKNGYVLVKKNDKYNYIDANGKYLSLRWFNENVEFQEVYDNAKKRKKLEINQ